MRFTAIRLAVVAIALVPFGLTAFGGTLDLNDIYNGGAPFAGDNYMWTDVIESNGNPEDPAVNFYRDPQVIDDTFIVNPTDFRVDITPGPGSLLLDSELEMVIMGNAGQSIPVIVFAESGDYEVLGFSTDAAFVKAEVNYFWQVIEGASAGASGMGSEVFEASAAPIDNGIWELGFVVNLPDDATKVRFSFDNRLTAQAEANAAAFIAKKLIGGFTITVPEPTSCGLLGLALATLFASRCRRSFK